MHLIKKSNLTIKSLLVTVILINSIVFCYAMDKTVINSYLGNVRTQMDNAWAPGEGKTDVVLNVSVDNNGKVLNKELVDNGSSKTGLDAVNQAYSKIKFPKLACDKNATIVVTFTFKSTYDKHGDSNATLACKLYIKQKVVSK